jgi:hypothetical protein
MYDVAHPPIEVVHPTHARRARVAGLRPEDGLAFGLGLAESRRLLAYGAFSLYLEARREEWRRTDQIGRTPGLALVPRPDRDAAGRAA